MTLIFLNLILGSVADRANQNICVSFKINAVFIEMIETLIK